MTGSREDVEFCGDYDWATHERLNREMQNRIVFDRLLREGPHPIPVTRTWIEWACSELCPSHCWPENAPTACPRCGCCAAEFNDCDMCGGGWWVCVGREPPRYYCHEPRPQERR